MASTLVTILNWNGIEDTLKCLDSLSNQTKKDFKVLVIDNGSKDNSKDILTSIKINNIDIYTIFNVKNLGFSGGVNQGIKYAIENGFINIILLNNDALVHTSWLQVLTDTIEQQANASAVTSLLLTEKGTRVDSTAEIYSTWGMPFPRSRGKKTSEAPDSGFVFGATGGATLYKTSLFKEIGLFDESFFAYYEDVDISFRAQLAGHKVFYSKKAIAYHKQGATSSKIPGFTVYQTFKNIPLLYIKNVPTKLLFPIGVRLLLSYTLMFGNAVKRGAGMYALKGWLASIYYFWKQSLWQRFSIQRHKKVSSKYIDSIIHHDLPPDQTGMRRFRKLFTGKD